MSTFVDSTETFISAADWLTDVDAPAVAALRAAARELDSGPAQAALIGAYRQCYAMLLKSRPKAPVKPSMLGGALAEAGVTP